MEWKENVVIYLWAGMGLMVFFALGVILFVIFYLKKIYQIKKDEQDNLLRACLAVERNERKNISAYLHDTVCNDIYGISIYISALEQQEQNPEKLKALDDVQQLMGSVLNKTRDISYMMMSPLLEFSGLVPALRDYFDRFNKLNNLHISFHCPRELPRIDLSISYEVYRILQELVNNMLKHGKVKNADILVEQKEQSIAILLKDDGIQFDIQKEFSESSGMGIKNIFSRVQLIGATLKQEKTITGNNFILKFNISDD